MFYRFRQNNSGGSFTYNEGLGISVNVIIEADNAYEANATAESLGIYFNGCDEGLDCDCCGDRWSPVGESPYDKTEEPAIYEDLVKGQLKMPKVGYAIKWIDGYEGFIHYKDGGVEGFWKE